MARRSLLLVALALGAGVAGCEKALFTETDMRSPYDAYDAVRGQRAEPYLYDEYGRRRPNLRARLMPKD